jgi:hypothetical protein
MLRLELLWERPTSYFAPSRLSCASIFDSRNDLEKDVLEVNYIHGYPSLAAVIASDSSAAIYCRFDYLLARALRYMQSKLCELESEVKNLEKADTEIGANEPHRDWSLFQIKSQDQTNDRWRTRMTLAKLIQEKLKPYRV